MAQVTNNSKITPIGLPNGVLVGPGQTVSVDKWGKVKGNKVVAYYLAHGLLTVEGGDQDEGSEDDEKQRILAQLKGLGINSGSNSKLETLQNKLAEAQAAAKADAIAKLKELGIQVGEDVGLEELQAELAKHQA